MKSLREQNMLRLADEEKKRKARLHVHDEIRKVQNAFKDSLKEIQGNVRTCEGIHTLMKIKEAYDRIEQLYPEYNFNLAKYIPHISFEKYDIMRMKSKKTFNIKMIKNIPFIIDTIKLEDLDNKSDMIESYIKNKKELYTDYFVNEKERDLFRNDMSSLEFFHEKDDGMLYTGLIGSKDTTHKVRYHSGYHHLIYTRDPATQKPIQFRENCIVLGVNSCTYIKDIPRKKRTDTSVAINKPIFYLERDDKYLSQIEIYAGDFSGVEAPEETEIYL